MPPVAASPITDSVFNIKTEVFEGPLELLLELVEKRKLLINDISLAAVTDEYLTTVSTLQERSLPGVAAFVQLAATLLLIKSKSLLPVLELTNEEESAIDELADRLKQYQVYKQAATTLRATFGARVCHKRRFVPRGRVSFRPDPAVSVSQLSQTMRHLLQTLPTVEEKPSVQVQPVITLKEMITRLHERIELAKQTTLRELLDGTEEPKTVIVGFLAILESVKQGRVLVAQVERFADITVEQQQFTTPRY